MKKPEMAAAAARATTGAFPDASWAGKYPTISQYLADGAWDDGTPRERSALSVFTEDGVVKLALNDKDLARSCYASGLTVEKCLHSMEKGLADGSAVWRLWKDGPKKRK